MFVLNHSPLSASPHHHRQTWSFCLLPSTPMSPAPTSCLQPHLLIFCQINDSLYFCFILFYIFCFQWKIREMVDYFIAEQLLLAAPNCAAEIICSLKRLHRLPSAGLRTHIEAHFNQNQTRTHLTDTLMHQRNFKLLLTSVSVWSCTATPAASTCCQCTNNSIQPSKETKDNLQRGRYNRGYTDHTSWRASAKLVDTRVLVRRRKKTKIIKNCYVRFSSIYKVVNRSQEKEGTFKNIGLAAAQCNGIAACTYSSKNI